MSRPLSNTDWLRAARELFADHFGPQTGSLTITLSNDVGESLTLKLPGTRPTETQAKLSPFEADVVRVLSAGPMQTKQIAARLGMKPTSSTLKTLLANLCERGVIASSPDGYQVTPGD